MRILGYPVVTRLLPVVHHNRLHKRIHRVIEPFRMVDKGLQLKRLVGKRD